MRIRLSHNFEMCHHINTLEPRIRTKEDTPGFAFFHHYNYACSLSADMHIEVWVPVKEICDPVTPVRLRVQAYDWLQEVLTAVDRENFKFFLNLLVD